MRYISQQQGITAINDRVCKTYTFSWENHYCKVPDLQQRLEQVCPEEALRFDFKTFLSRLSKIIFDPFLVISFHHRNRTPEFHDKTFASKIPNQILERDIVNNGQSILDKIKIAADDYMQSPLAQQVDLQAETDYLENLGITQDNVYLHFRGHNIYNLVCHIGDCIVPKSVSFENEILNHHLPNAGYWEYDKVLQDIDDATK